MPRETYSGDLTEIKTRVRDTREVLPFVGTFELCQGTMAMERITDKNVYVLKFVINPGPNSQLIVLKQESGRYARVGHPLTGVLLDCDSYIFEPESRLPHQAKFSAERLIVPEDVPEILGKMALDTNLNLDNRHMSL